MQEVNETPEQNCVGLTVQREARCTNDLLAILPPHKASLSLEHNMHKNNYESAAEWIEHNDWCDWEDENSKQKAIDTNEVRTLQWYPDTPVGFCAIAAPTLSDILRLAGDIS